MSKLVLNNITSGYASSAAVNTNNDLIEAAMENTLSLDGTTPNSMGADLDMNGYDIYNVATISTGLSGGTTANRPASPTDYQTYFDTDLGIPIWYDGANWVNASGTTV